MNNNSTEENVIVNLKSPVVQERTLVKSNDINTTLFQSLLVTFSSSLLTQVIFLIPPSYKIFSLLPNILLVVCILATLIMIVLKKEPNLKSYLLLIAFLIGVAIGI